MKKISICICCFNEQENVEAMYEVVKKQMETISKYNFEIIFADNASTDNTQQILKKLAAMDKRVKVILNNRNFGAARSGWNCVRHSSGDAMITLACDFQDPPELIPEFIKYWEEGEVAVILQKVKSKENKIKYLFRRAYYKIITIFSEIPQYEQVTGAGLYDKQIVEQFKKLDATVSYRHLMAEFGYPVKLIPFIQPKRKAGKSSYNIARYFDFAMNSLVTTSTTPLRIATIIGTTTSIISFLIGVVYLIYKLVYWNSFSAGIAPMVISVFFLGSIQILFIGLIGEYIANIIGKLSKTPIVVEKELINFEESNGKII